MKSERQNRILELVSKYEIETQEDMIERLRSEGYMVTQATVSRDLKELKLTKALTARGTYRYCVSQSRNHTGNVRLNNAMADSILHVDYSMNNVVIKTYPGLAQAVASAIDAMNMHSILGCVAGDDTIIIVSRDEKSSAEISEKIRELMKAL
ncbi:MAG: arginine repressor [Clostridia bacterium]|nr:arginine repressor [Clostridia bacterium]